MDNMRFTVERQVISDAVTNLSRAVATKSTIPVLEGINLIAEGSCLKMLAYNLDLGMTKVINIKCEKPGSVVINSRLFGEMLRKMSGDFVSISVDERLMCKIESSSAVFEILGMASNDFPEMPVVDNSKKLSLPCEQLKDMVRQTIFAVGIGDGVRPILTGILFEIYKDVICLTAVDGYRLAIRKEKTVSSGDISFIASGKAIGEAVKIITDDDKNVEIEVGKRHISINIGGYSLISRLLEGEFVNYQESMPYEFTANAKINTKQIISIIERISLIINDQIKTPVRCKIDGDKITFSCSTAIGRATDSCLAKIEGDEFEIGFNSKFLLDALKATENEEVILNFNGPLSPMIIKPIDSEDFIYMVMPMRLKAEA